MGGTDFGRFTLGYDRVLLVEGVHDVKVFKQFLRKYKLEQKTVVLFLGGNQLATADRDHELAEIARLSSKVFVIADSERESADGPPIAERVALEGSCKKAKIPILLTELRATENYFSDRAVKEALRDSYAALAPYESLKKKTENGWAKADNWKIAARMTFDELDKTDIGAFIRDVVAS